MEIVKYHKKVDIYKIVCSGLDFSVDLFYNIYYVRAFIV